MSSLPRSQQTIQRQNLDSCSRDFGVLFVCFCFLKHTSASLFNLFSCLVLMHNLLDDVECTVEKG